MGSFSETWGFYQDMKANRRRREQDDINNERYADQLKQQSLANTRADEQLSLAQDRNDLSQTQWDAGSQGRADQKILDQQQIDANILSLDENQQEQLAERTEQLVFKASENGAEALFADPTERPIIHRLIGDALNAGKFIPDGYKFSGFEEISGPPNKDGSGANLFVPMIEDAQGNKMDIGQMLGGEGASAFTADQVVKFIENTGQAYQNTTTSMGINTLATPSAPNAGDNVVQQQQQQQVVTEQQQTEQQQTAPVETPVVQTPVVQQSLAGTTEVTTPEVPVDAPTGGLASTLIQTAVAEMAEKTQGGVNYRGSQEHNAAVDAEAEKIVDLFDGSRVKARDFVENQVNALIAEQNPEYAPLERVHDDSASYSEQFGAMTGNVLDAVKNAVATPFKGASAAIDVAGEMGSDFVDGLTNYEAPVTKVTTSSSANTKAIVKQETKLKETPATPEETAKVASDSIIDARQMQQTGAKKRPTQEQRTARSRRIAIRRAGEESISAEQADRYINTGFMQKDDINIVTVGNYDYEQTINGEGYVSYKNVGMNKTAQSNFNKADIAKLTVQKKATEDFYKKNSWAAMSAAAVQTTVDTGTSSEKKITSIGPYANQDNFPQLAEVFINNHGASLAPMLGFDPTNGPTNLGEERLLTGVMTAYAAALSRSKDGEISYSNTNNFSKFIKSYSGVSGNYIIGNRMVNLDTRVDEQVKKLGGDPALIRATVRAALEAEQGAID